MITAPPTFIFANTLAVRAALDGGIDPSRLSNELITLVYSGAEIDFIRPIWVGDRIYAQERVEDIYRKQSKRVGPICFCTELASFYNQRNELVATVRTLAGRFENPRGGISYDKEDSSGTIRESPDPLVWERQRRGNETLYWEDVQEGEEPPTLKKGTYTPTEMYQFSFNVTGAQRATRARIEGAGGSIDLGGGGRGDAEYAQGRRAMQGIFDFGPQRVCWLSQIVTDWMGDEGTLKSLSARISNPNVVGDTNTVKGQVTKKYIEDGQHLVEVRVTNENQSGTPTALGSAIVALPSKSTD